MSGSMPSSFAIAGASICTRCRALATAGPSALERSLCVVVRRPGVVGTVAGALAKHEALFDARQCLALLRRRWPTCLQRSGGSNDA
jgi:hypothetical protein